MDKLEEANDRMLKRRKNLVSMRESSVKPLILTIPELQKRFEERAKQPKLEEYIQLCCQECRKPCEEVDLSVDILDDRGNKVCCIPCVDKKRESLIDYVYQVSGIPVMYKEARLQGENRSLFLSGGNGIGKTYKAAGIICNWIEKLNYQQLSNCYDMSNNCPIFITVPELLMKIRNCFSLQQCEESVVEKYSRCPVLVLDDLGVEKTTEWALQTLYIILNNRYSNFMQTIITSNLSIEEIGEKLGDRIASRIAGMCKIVKLTGKDRRICNERNTINTR